MLDSPARHGANHSRRSIDVTPTTTSSDADPANSTRRTILCVDDGQLIHAKLRGILSPTYEVESVRNGKDALDLLVNHQVDVILLDINMPVLDGVETLRKLRVMGNQTPVILLTSESRPELIRKVAEHGISDYILKPPKPSELLSKIAAALPTPSSKAADVKLGEDLNAETISNSLKYSSVFKRGEQPLCDILVVDDMESVMHRLRSMMPDYLKIDSATNKQSAFSKCRKKIYRTLVVDMVIPHVDSVALARQLQELQPTCHILALFLRSIEHPTEIANNAGFHGYLLKPFDPMEIDAFAESYFDPEQVLICESSTIEISAFPPDHSARETRMQQLRSLLNDAIDNIAAAACFDEVVLDLSTEIPDALLARIVAPSATQCHQLRLELRIVGNKHVAKVLAQTTDTAKVPVYRSIDAALPP